jgi:hypothetical protein
MSVGVITPTPNSIAAWTFRLSVIIVKPYHRIKAITTKTAISFVYTLTISRSIASRRNQRWHPF